MNVWCKITALILLATLVSGDQLYNFTQICCDGAVHDYSYEDYNSCCGKKLISYSRAQFYDENSVNPLCCDEVVQEPENKSLQCCGKKLYNVQTSICYNFSDIVPIPLENLDINETEACGKSINDLTFYNPLKTMCCEGQLRENQDKFYCCGEVSYDSLTSLCCGDNKVIDVGNATDKACCGDDYFDNTEARCCYDDVKLEDGKYKSVGLVINFNGKNATTAGCCGHAIYDYEKEMCCSDGPKFIPDKNEGYSCCETGLIQWKQLCVNGKGVDRIDFDQEVCGDSIVYRPSKEACYNNTLIKHGENESVCYSNGKLYNTTTQICYGDSIIDLTNEEIEGNKYNYCEEYLAKE